MATMAETEKDTLMKFCCRNAVLKERGMSVDYNEKQKLGMQCTQVEAPTITDPNEIVGFVHLASGATFNWRRHRQVKTVGGFRPK
jgi:hypothetical protein